MDARTLTEMAALADRRYIPPNIARRILSEEGGMGAAEPTVDHHLSHAHHHATAALTASRLGDADAAQKHSAAANKHLLSAAQKQRAEDHPSAHGPDEKMVFGVWRKTGKEHSPAEHHAIGDKYARHAHRQKQRIDTRAMLSGVHPSEVPDHEKDHHYREVKQALSLAKTHYAGQDPMKHPGIAKHPHKQGAAGAKPEVQGSVADSRVPLGNPVGEGDRPLPLLPTSRHNPAHQGLQNIDPHPYLHSKHPDAKPGATTQIKGHNYVKGQNGKWRYTHRTPITP